MFTIYRHSLSRPEYILHNSGGNVIAEELRCLFATLARATLLYACRVARGGVARVFAIMCIGN